MSVAGFLLSEVVAKLGGELHGEDVRISGIASLEAAGMGEISFLANPKYRKQLASTQAGAVIVSADALADLRKPAIVCRNPYLYFAKVSSLLNPVTKPSPGRHVSVVVAASARIDATAAIGALATIGENAVIGPGVVIGAGCRIGDGVSIGADSCLYPNVVIYPQCVVGERVIIHAGAVLGADGFGLAWDQDHWFKIPQIGRVVIGNDVEIGANTTIDRGALGDTVLADDVKLDNQIQIAHNVQIGAHTALAGCVGVAGSTRIGAHCTFGGSAMVLGHLEIADRVNVMAGTLVGKSIKQAGTYTGWYPVQKHEDWLSNAAHLRHLDKLAQKVKALERQLATLGVTAAAHDEEAP